MTKETVHKLSQLVRDRDLEIEALRGRNEGLVALLKQHEAADNGQNQLAALVKEKQDLFDALKMKHQESLNYYAEIERLNRVLHDERGRSASPAVAASHDKKAVQDNSNEIRVLKARIKDLERKLNVSRTADGGDKGITFGGGQRRRYHSESVATSTDDDEGSVSGKVTSVVNSGDEARLREELERLEATEHVLKEKEDQMVEQRKEMQATEEELNRAKEELRGYKRKADSLVSCHFVLKRLKF